MIDADLLRHLESLDPERQLELIAHLWTCIDRHPWPQTDAPTLCLEVPIALRRGGDDPIPFPPSTAASPGSSPPAPA